jgi:pyruvate dehydrogenase E2 component (dihydrolipoamide acetyltransferase)
VTEYALAARKQDAGRVSPFARGLAAELGIDIAALAAGKGGRVGAAQVLAAALVSPTPPLDFGPEYRIERPSSFKTAMAENMARSVSTPTFRVTVAVDLEPVQQAAHAARQSFTLLLARACALSVHEHPDFNACWTPAGLARRERIDVAIAVDTPDGLLTPVLRDALRPLEELSEDWRQLKGKLEHRRLVPADYRGATFHLSNLGPFPDIEQFDALVPSGTAAILAIAAPSADGLTRLTLSCDHRVVAGADAARFLSSLKERLATVDEWMDGKAADERPSAGGD